MEYNDLPENRITQRRESDTPQIFRTLRNIDLNLLTIFEAVYVHKGIVNAAKILNLTPSAISQSIQKLRTIFPDPLFIRKGQGVTPTAYATHLHEYISQGLESILGALDLTGSYDKQRTITIGTPPSVGAVVMPEIYQTVKQHFPQLLIRNVAVTDAPNQLGQFQTDLIIDSCIHSARTISHHALYSDSLVLACRENHPILARKATPETLNDYEFTLLMLEGQTQVDLRRRMQDMFPDRQVSFSSYNLFTVAALVGTSDLLGLMPGRFFTLFEKCWPLKKIHYPPLQEEQIEFSLHYNKLSLRDPILQNLITVIRQTF
ncbi:MAG: YbeF family transcriptional regulator [Yokenella regensburgei]|uniref:DNA-binding transcriptional LysR family regulator n=1 Tax=Yokenella regensburgei TaxID=158877 RepID=A0ABX9S7V5_9ENTR|nr:YbeF family transcriptional regulator [Yokenella regensburgei]EHM48445.1 transcriptional regulator, LysR family [Yokenella regensburgei ATCC 43003]KAF1370939.1 DNA-binding transcriptional LysR family regulator [Yokenella regensburgei]MDQ4431342.1 YbeF family transcriptional regulator [Yokenella regensburgei]MDR2218198.1 YbeF family transcriptional regulator [Yokenella regensburgei]MDR3102977.1 YbeF family transcriptional regulator [Yokenella regensburgei]